MKDLRRNDSNKNEGKSGIKRKRRQESSMNEFSSSSIMGMDCKPTMKISKSR